MTTGILQNELVERSASSRGLTSWHFFRTVAASFPLETDQYDTLRNTFYDFLGEITTEINSDLILSLDYHF